MSDVKLNIDLKEYLDEKFKPLYADMAVVKETINGTDEKPGLVEKVRNIEKKFGYAMAVIGFGVSLFTVLIQDFFRGKIKL